jgi:protein-tyrosine phosphatase
MIDLHSHILPGIDDGATDLDVSLEMARIAVADGVEVQACTPHILPGLYHNTGPQIRAATWELQQQLDAHGIPLQLITGADAHLVPDMAGGLRSGHILSLADTRYVLVEPPHHVAPLRLEEFFFGLLLAGYVPILTHPERLTWIEQHYPTMVRLFDAGVWMQITAGSLTGAFGRAPRYWSERMLNEGRVHILASDAHGINRRRPNLGEGRAAAAKWVGEAEAENLVLTRPRGILENVLPTQMPALFKPSSAVSHKAAFADRDGRSNRGGGNRRSNVARADDDRRGGGGRSFADRLRSFFE